MFVSLHRHYPTIRLYFGNRRFAFSLERTVIHGNHNLYSVSTVINLIIQFVIMDILNRVGEISSNGCNDEVGTSSDGRPLCDVCMVRPSVDITTCWLHRFCRNCKDRFSHSRGCPICGSLRVREMEKITGKPYITPSTYKPIIYITSSNSSVIDSNDDDEISRSIQLYTNQQSSNWTSDETVLPDSDSNEDEIGRSIQYYQPPVNECAVTASIAATPVNHVVSVSDTRFSPFTLRKQKPVLM